MQVRLLLMYDILPGRDQEYFEFLVRELAPGLARLGIQPNENWYTQFGEYPQILLGGIGESYAAVKKTLSSKEWEALRKKMAEYVTNIQHKVVRMSPYFPLVK
ncbi:MAG: hypothetical protein IAE83_02845 [Anaerolinea sp.]|nr:hypothetical protein [Anaerolinea sp.]MCC6974827.1 hypothetical protein [Anaerolineae bacterium]